MTDREPAAPDPDVLPEERPPPPEEPHHGAEEVPRLTRRRLGGAMSMDAPHLGRPLASPEPGAGPADIRRLRKIGVGLGILAVLLLIPTPPDMTFDGKASIALFVFLVYMWITEALPLPVTALLAGVGLLLLGIKDEPNEAFEPYAQDTFFFILGSLILADGITKSGADEVLAQRILKMFGFNTHTLLFGIVASTSLLAMFVSDHAIAAIMLPLILGVLRSTGLRKNPRIAAAFLMAIAFGANIAGLATPSGGSRNAIALGYLRDQYDVRVDYLDWMVHAAPITLALIPLVYIVLAVVYRLPWQRIDRALIVAERRVFTGRQKVAVGILVLTVGLWMLFSDTLGLGTVAIIGAVLMFAAGILDWEDTRSTIPWGVAFVYGAALVMGRVLKDTGAADWLASHAFAFLPVDNVVVLVLVVLVFTVLLTNVLSDGATVAVIAPITLSLAFLSGYPVASMGILTAVTSAFAFVLIIGTPPNLIVYASGLVRPRDFLKAGIPLTVLAIAVTVVAVFWYWPML